MTAAQIDEDDAIKLERAAMLILRIVHASKHGGSAWLKATISTFPAGHSDAPERRRESLAAAKDTLNLSKAWRDAT